MSDLGNKAIFSKNLRMIMERFGKTRNQICDDLEIKYTTFADWYNGKKYPRIDSVEILASYFGLLKSDLIEDKGGVLSIDEKPHVETAREVLASEGIRILFDADANLTEVQINEIVSFIRFKRGEESH